MNSEDSSIEKHSSDIGKPFIMSKRGAVVKERIQQFYSQLTDGCGRPNCTNSDCASNPNFEKLSSDDAAAKALNLLRNKVSLCDKPPSKIARKDSVEADIKSSSSQECQDNCSSGEPSNCITRSPESSHSSLTSHSSSESVSTSQSSNDDNAKDNSNDSDSCSGLPASEHPWDSALINSKLQSISVHESSGSSSRSIPGITQPQFQSYRNDTNSSSIHYLKRKREQVEKCNAKQHDAADKMSGIEQKERMRERKCRYKEAKKKISGTPATFSETTAMSSSDSALKSISSHGKAIKHAKRSLLFSPNKRRALEEMTQNPLLSKYPTKKKKTTSKGQNGFSDSERRVLEELSNRELSPALEDTELTSLKDGIWTVFSKSSCLNLFCVPTKEVLNSRKECDEDKDIDEDDQKLQKNGKEKLSMDDLDEDIDANNTTSKTEATSTTVCLRNSSPKVYRPTVDIEHIRSLYALWGKHPSLERVMHNSIAYVINDIEQKLSANKQGYMQDPNYLNVFVVLVENPSLHSPEALDKTFPLFCKVISRLPIPAQAALAHYWSEYDQKHLRNIIEDLQQLITFKIVSEEETDDDSSRQVNSGIVFASKCLNILFYASILGGKMDKDVDQSGAKVSVRLRETSKTAAGLFSHGTLDDLDDGLQFTWVDPLGKELNVNKLDSIEPVVPLAEFINEPLNDSIKIDKDYTNYRISQQISTKFSFLHYPFLLNTASKTTHLFYDNRVTMYSERRRTVFSSIMQGSVVHPYLKLQVRRTHIIEDTLVQLELATENVKDLKKQLYVEFDGEEGVDEGGVSKEFFQLVVDKIFNPENGMFVYSEETHLFWFNPQSFEALTQYRLTGIVLGLAIYNNCILDVNLPPVIYKKLLGKKGKFHDLAGYNPLLYKSLQELLRYEGNVEEDLMLTFRVEYQDVFGTTHYHDLKEGGEDLPVTSENRQDYVHLYADWLLNVSISEQFNALLSGFDLVVSESPLKYLFYHDELELLVSGSEDYDFDELERTTEYDGGFTKTSETIVDFWSVVHALTEEEKRSLLQFSTGSDRAPVGGLAKLKMIIARNGPDSNRLPTAHTCFNVILLPDYKNREKMKERLLKAIKYSKGFGML